MKHTISDKIRRAMLLQDSVFTAQLRTTTRRTIHCCLVVCGLFLRDRAHANPFTFLDLSIMVWHSFDRILWNEALCNYFCFCASFIWQTPCDSTNTRSLVWTKSSTPPSAFPKQKAKSRALWPKWRDASASRCAVRNHTPCVHVTVCYAAWSPPSTVVPKTDILII